MTRSIIFLFVITSLPCAHAQDTERDIIQKIDALLLNSNFREAIELTEARSSLLINNKKAEALIRSGNFDEAEKVIRSIDAKLKDDSDEFLTAVTEMTLGFLQLHQGRSDLAEESLQNALRKFERTGKDNGPEAAQAVSHLGIVYMSLGKYTQAQEQLHRALALRQGNRQNTEVWMAASLNDLGLAYSQTDKEKALDYFEQAQKMYGKLYGPAHPKNAIANINIGIIYRDLQLFGDAANNFETALNIWNEVYPNPHPAKAMALYNLGQTYLSLQDQAAAIKYYRLAHKMYEDCYGPNHPEITSVLNAIGNLYLAEGEFGKALDTYQKSLQANVRDFTDSDWAANPSLRNYYNGSRLLHTLLFKAQAFETRYLRKSLKFSDLKEALIILAKCDSLIDQLRQHTTNEADKLLLGVLANEVYSDGVRISHEAGLNALQKQPYFEQAFYFAEKSKGAVLLESINETNAKSFSGISNDLLEEEKNLKSALTLTSQKLAQKPSADEEKILRERSFNLKRQYEAYLRKVKQQCPGYFDLKFNSSTPSIAGLQMLLNNKTALISYFVDEKSSLLYIFVIRKNQFKVFQKAFDKNFDKYITGLRNGLYFNEIATFQKSAQELGRLLIPSIPSSVSDLVIVPSGRLALIPFETLLVEDADKITEYSSMPYLIQRFSVRYEFSAGLLLQKSKKNSNFVAPSIFLCAPVNFPGKDNLSQLPGTEIEVAGISTLFSEKNLIASAYTGLQADERLMKSEQLKNYHFVHLATHGLVDELNPELSRIFLQPGTEGEDGNLFAGEIYNLELNASLVTLSACQTGLGKIVKGEGVIGLSRALVYAGAKNVVVSFWNVADESTAILMKQFYQNILESAAQDYTDALRRAKQQLLQHKQYAAPFYWAPFVLIGY